MSTSSAPGTPSAEPSAATAAAPASPPLPDELWLKILKELNYSGLQKAGQLCKKFKGFLQDPSFDDAMFRAKPPQELVVGMDVTIHPLLHLIDCLIKRKSSVQHASLMKSGRLAFRYAAVDEYATSPSCRTMYLDVGVPQCVWIDEPDGITVRHVLTSLGGFWGSRPPRSYFTDVYGGDGRDYDDTWDFMEWWLTLSDMPEWQGWASAGIEVDEEGDLAVVLTAISLE